MQLPITFRHYVAVTHLAALAYGGGERMCLCLT
jgi:hypothetical protein